MSSVFEAQPMDNSVALQADVGATFHDTVRMEYIVFLEECQCQALTCYDPYLKEILEWVEFSPLDTDAATMEMELGSPEESNHEASNDSLDVNTPSRSDTFYRPNNLSKLARPVLASAIKHALFHVRVSNQNDFVEQMKAKEPKCPEWALREIFEELPPSFKSNRKDSKNKRLSA